MDNSEEIVARNVAGWRVPELSPTLPSGIQAYEDPDLLTVSCWCGWTAHYSARAVDVRAMRRDAHTHASTHKEREGQAMIRRCDFCAAEAVAAYRMQEGETFAACAECAALIDSEALLALARRIAHSLGGITEAEAAQWLEAFWPQRGPRVPLRSAPCD